MDGYTLTKLFYSQLLEDEVMQHQCTAHHNALFFWIVEKQNIVGWKVKIFGLPSDEAMKYSCIKDRNTYHKKLNELIEWGFVNLIQKSTNAHVATKISLRTKKFEEFTCT